MAHALVAEALSALRQADFATARIKMQRYAADNTREAQHYLIEGLASLALADWEAAAQLFTLASIAFPKETQFWFNRGLAEENLGKFDAATISYRQTLTLKPDHGEACGNLSNIFRKQGRFPEAVQMACRAVASDVPKADALNVLGLALSKQGNFVEAQRAFDDALLIAPQDAAILANRANLAVDQLKFEEAWILFAAARQAGDNPTLQRDEGMARLLAGDYAAGLPLYEARLALPNALRVTPACPRWQGENLSGKTLLLVSEQGFGDTIQFSRYAPQLVAMGANLIWTVRQPLQRLLAANLPGQVILEADPLPDTDFWLPILSLPLALGMTSPTAVPLNFKAPTEPKLPGATSKRKIGLVWSGSPTHERDHERSLPLVLLAPLVDTIDAEFYAPFVGASTALSPSVIPAKAGIQTVSPTQTHTNHAAQPMQIASLDSGFRRNDAARKGVNIISLDHLITDFADSAALIGQLDCLVTVDTASAHLAGALGVPTYLLLPYCPDWRWGVSGETTAWYQSVTTLRQPHYGDWASVVESLIKKLA